MIAGEGYLPLTSHTFDTDGVYQARRLRRVEE